MFVISRIGIQSNPISRYNFKHSKLGLLEEETKCALEVLVNTVMDGLKEDGLTLTYLNIECLTLWPNKTIVVTF